ncbi:MAG: NUDIX domain-containing protein [Clostridia bacterium]
MEKILTFIVRDNKLLLLLGSDQDPQYHKSFWYVVTGGCEKEDSSLEDTVKREVLEETGLTLNKIINLNWTFEYESLGEHCVEHAFVSFADNDKIKLNEESIDYKWCDLDEFIKFIEWYGDKQELKERLIKFL